jgi:hypothetical protein
MNRYLDANNDFETMFNDVITNEFNWLESVKFKLLFNTKKRVSKGSVVLTAIELTNEKVKFLTADANAPEGYDCLLTMDALAWQYASEIDRKRMISHELSHISLEETGKLKIVGHDIEDFATEIQKNIDDPSWVSKLHLLVQSIYDQQEDQDQENVVQ